MALPIDHMTLAKPLHVQRVEQALQLEPFLDYIEGIVNKQNLYSDLDDTTDGDTDITKDTDTDTDGNKTINGIIIKKAERKADKTRLYNFSRVKKSRKWLKTILLSDSSSDEEEDAAVTNDQMKEMLKLHRYQQQCTSQFYRDKELRQYQYYGVGLLSNADRFYDHQKMIVGPKKKLAKDQKKLDKKMKAKLKKIKKEKKDDSVEPGEIDSKVMDAILKTSAGTSGSSKPHKVKKLTPEQIAARRRKIYTMIAKKEIPKAQKQKASARKEMLSNLKKISHQCVKECRREAMQSQRLMKETPMRARRLTREMLTYWKRFEKVEKEHRKRAEKEAQEQRKLDLELREMKRQQRKLNFLITQTELYAHFMSHKLTGDSGKREEQILQRLNETSTQSQREVRGGLLTDQEEDNYNPEAMKNLAIKNAEDAYSSHQAKIDAFDHSIMKKHLKTAPSTNPFGDLSLSNPAISTEVECPQPCIFEGKLKGYQLKGMNWLANLYNQGINGILADEMGLGKTVQSISFLGHLAEAQGIWGPFLIIAPASTLHNWQQELARFIPTFKVVPYWGNLQDRKILRKFWNQEYLHTQDASFHVVITSYQLVIQDVKYFQRIKWQYMILDEAQAIKSSSSARWKTLLGFNCRNRMLLTGTPIQNSMAELWALLHFIMPTLFDSHEEFGEWFSKDIESHAEKQSGIDENQLSRLHMILKPFMLRRIKKDVENELSDKIEILVYCPLTRRQKLLYQAVKNKIRIEDLLQSSSGSTQAITSTNSLMNFVMQFRKVCNHPELFERREVRGPLCMRLDPYYIPKLIFRDGILQQSFPSKQRLLYNLLYIFSPTNIHSSLSTQENESSVDSCFSFLRFIDTSPQEMYAMMLSGLLVRWLAVFLWLKQAYRIHSGAFWQESDHHHHHHHQHHHHRRHRGLRLLDKKAFLLSPLSTMSPANIISSPHLRHLVFTKVTSCVYTHDKVTFHYMEETQAHRKIRLRRHDRPALGSPSRKFPGSPPLSPKKSHSLALSESAQHPHIVRSPKVLPCQPLEIPSFLYYTLPKVRASVFGNYCIDRSASWCQMREALCGTLEARNSLLCGTSEIYEERKYKKYYLFPRECAGLNAITPKYGYSGVYVPDKETLVTDAGKLYVLDTLLGRLKAEGHRVLIYSQMTKVIDLLEEYMWHRKHTYMRLDGSSKISERRDMVADFQAKSDIFVFLLSTRAGGLGINLTAADTVIFYDSDWNPTVDQQAMDRAHRLGQTKQVTVYRLICKGTIEERILQRAKEKSEIQRMVISGGNFRPDVLKPKEVVSLLLDDDEMERKLRQKQEEKSNRDDGDKKRKREKNTDKKKDGDGPGRKKRKAVASEESNLTIPAPDTDSVISMDSTSAAASPQSVMSVGSELNPALFSLPAEDSSNDGLVIVDDAHSTFPPVKSETPPPPKRGRGRGRPRGSGAGRRPRGRGSLKKALSAAEIAGAQAGMTAAYKAYGYNLAGSTPPPSSRKTGRGGIRTPNNGTPSGSSFSTPSGSPRSQQS